MKKHLIIVDVQNDFCMGGSLPTAKGADIVPIVNRLANSGFFDTIVATQDWHPANHCSFEEWPTHCVQNDWGAELREDLDSRNFNIIMRKGMRKDVDSYSAFKENDGTETRLVKSFIPDADDDNELYQEFYICGIATDVCVKATAIDCINSFGPSFSKVYVFVDACAPVTEEGEREALKEMVGEGINLMDAEIWLDVREKENE
jgi:nicotinamidase/pyrazinamidase